MRFAIPFLVILNLAACEIRAQVGGNVGYGQAGGHTRAEQNERAKRQLTREEMPPTDKAMFVDASVLMNVKADQFVATFGVAAEAETVEGCQEKMNSTIAAFTEALKPLGIGPEATFVDFTAQTKVYDYKVEGNIAREHFAGFVLKKTVAVRYRDKAMIDRLALAASKAKVYDLVKVDYVVTDMAPIQERLAEEAAAAVKAKVARHERLLGIKLQAPPRSMPSGLPSISRPKCTTLIPPANPKTSRAVRIARGRQFNLCARVEHSITTRWPPMASTA